jgi:hypothetical protein
MDVSLRSTIDEAQFGAQMRYNKPTTLPLKKELHVFLPQKNFFIQMNF